MVGSLKGSTTNDFCQYTYVYPALRFQTNMNYSVETNAPQSNLPASPTLNWTRKGSDLEVWFNGDPGFMLETNSGTHGAPWGTAGSFTNTGGNTNTVTLAVDPLKRVLFLRAAHY